MIVTMNHQIYLNLYDAIIKLRPDWHTDDLNLGQLKESVRARMKIAVKRLLSKYS